MTLREKNREIRRLKEQVQELNNRLCNARKVRRDVALWKWDDAPQWMRGAAHIANALPNVQIVVCKRTDGALDVRLVEREYA